MPLSLPNIPDIIPEINLDREDVINLLLASIALEEIALSHILNAEGEKLQAIIMQDCSLANILLVNKSVNRTLKNVIKKEMLLQMKLEEVLEIEIDFEKFID